MLLIRPEQMEVFETTGLNRFEEELLQELNRFAPSHCELIGTDGVRDVLHLGMLRAQSHGLTQRGSVRLYIELMFMFGSWFDSDVQHPWAAEVLSDESLPDQMLRAEALHFRMLDYLGKVFGPDRAFPLKALRQIRAMADESISDDPVILRGELPSRLVRIYPEKCAWLGESRVNAVVEGSSKVALQYQINSPRGILLICLLAFMLGHRFDSDPLYRWISRSLSNGRIDQLESKARIYLEHAIREMET